MLNSQGSQISLKHENEQEQAQGLNRIQLQLDCRPCHSSPANSLSATSGLKSPVGSTNNIAYSLSSSSHRRLELHTRETSRETLPLPSPLSPVPLSLSSSASSLYTLSPTIPAASIQAPSPVAQSPPSSPRHSSFHVEAGSPKFRSPLRNSVTYSDVSDSLGIYTTDHNDFLVPRTQSRHNRIHSLDMALTGDKRSRSFSKPVEPLSAMAASSVPSPTSDGSRSRWFARGRTPSYALPSSPVTTAPPCRTRSASSTPKLGSPASRLSFFSSPTQEIPTSSMSVLEDDQLINLDIESALFPGGNHVEGTTFSPAAFKNLQMNAIGLLNKFQVAYQQRTNDCQRLQSELDAQEEDKEEVDTRIRHLKMQLEDLAQQAAQREETMASLEQELAMEKRARAEEQAARDKYVASSRTSTVSEDLSIDEDRQRMRRNWRTSNGTTKSDLSVDTDEDSIDEASIFSRSRSPTIATTMSETSPVCTPTIQQRQAMLEPHRPGRNSNSQLSTFQKLFKGYSAEASDSSLSLNGCRNCQGRDASVAWDTVSLLKDENKGLKTRVQELETAVESALDVVNGIAL
ncbi:hypothetical protein BGZ63DRAFT_388868 [Mariannaea sp. PMI_226]|nr:hypothetical protein BGZ63DRAFT_388868 [Mariannaea sp. PMI_226]